MKGMYTVMERNPYIFLNDKLDEFMAIRETARLTDAFENMSEDKLAELSAKMQVLTDKLSEQLEITVTYFIPDEKKSGGFYAEKTGTVRIIDEYERKLVFYGGDRIEIDKIVDFKGEIFSVLESLS